LVEETIFGHLFDRFTIVPLITVKTFGKKTVGIWSLIHIEFGVCLEKGNLKAFNLIFKNNIFLGDEGERGSRGVDEGKNTDLDIVVVDFFDGSGFSSFKKEIDLLEGSG